MTQNWGKSQEINLFSWYLRHPAVPGIYYLRHPAVPGIYYLRHPAVPGIYMHNAHTEQINNNRFSLNRQLDEYE